ncbi:MAG: hypothetical protein LBO64_10140 [Desulfovibrio sp.]|nr:hypothetical protein [Desulfovibrio sp.]
MNTVYSLFSRPPQGRKVPGLALALIFCLLMTAPDEVRAGWLLDEGRFHVSAHGDIACADCHENVTGAQRHPNPGYVSKSAPTFNKAQCLECHSDIETDSGLHAGKPVQPDKDYGRCVSCHNPHTVMTAGGAPAAFKQDQPVKEQCGVCHEARESLPALSAESETCMSCHRAQTGVEGNSFCLVCHGAEQKMPGILKRTGVLDEKGVASATHRNLACAACHGKSAEFPHSKQTRAACTQCHSPHGEAQAHDAHIGVACESCHLPGVKPVSKLAPDGARAGTGFVFTVDKAVDKSVLRVHDMRAGRDEQSCARCHFSGNTLGAAAAVLPAKSVLCMGCHAATFTAGDASSFPFLLLFCGGVVTLGATWLTGAARHSGKSHKKEPLAKRLAHLAGVVFYDILLQRRLYRESPERWGIHALIFFPFLFRFVWGMIALLTSLWIPDRELPWFLLNKNSGLGGLLFDLSGLALLAGIVLAARYWRAHPQTASGIPRRDWYALALLGGITASGFVLEGMRIAMTGMPDGAGGAFIGYVIALPLNAAVPGPSLSEAYSLVWYAHALLTGATVAYIPFSQLRHVITAPLVMFLDALRGEE